MSLFVLSCKDGWVSIMYDGLDAVGVDQQVKRRTDAHTYRRRERLREVKYEYQGDIQTIHPMYIVFHCVWVLFCVSLRHHLILFVSSRKGKYFRREGRCKKRKKADG